MSFFYVSFMQEHHYAICEAYSGKLKLVEQRLRITKFPTVGMSGTRITLVSFSPVWVLFFCLVITFMGAHVTSKMMRLSETFVANMTSIWFITCVNTQMSLETG